MTHRGRIEYRSRDLRAVCSTCPWVGPWHRGPTRAARYLAQADWRAHREAA